MTTNAQDDVRAAIADLTKTETSDVTATEATPAETPVDSAVGASDSALGTSGADSSDSGGDSQAGVRAKDSGNDGRARGPDGKFLPKAAEAKTVPPKVEAKTETPAPVNATTATTPPPAPAVTTPTLKAPQSWKADVREKFNALPPEVQAEVLRRETEMAQTFQAIAPAKKLQAVVSQHEDMFKAEGADPAQAIGGILQTVRRLATGSAQEKAAIVAQMVRGYGVDIETLARTLDAPPQQAAPAAIDPAAIERRVLERMQAQQEEAAIAQAIQQFGAEPREFMADVEPMMAAIVQSARARGETPSAKMLQDAYDKACWATPEVRAALQQREAGEKAKAAAAAAQKAKAAAVSVRPTHAVAPPVASSGSPQDDVRAAIAELRNRTT
jgi:hypothetical protein